MAAASLLWRIEVFVGAGAGIAARIVVIVTGFVFHTAILFAHATAIAFAVLGAGTTIF